MEKKALSSWPPMVNLDNLPCLIWYAKTPLAADKLNHTWSRLCQAQIIQDLTKNWDNCIHPLDRITRTVTLQRAFANQQPYELEYRLKINQNNYIWLYEQTQINYSKTGNFAGFIGFCLDINHRKKNESHLVQLGSIIESSDDAIYSIDLNDNILSWNRGAQSLYGYSKAEIVGRQIFDLIPTHLTWEYLQAKEMILQGEYVGAYETVRRQKDGTLFNASISVSPLKNEDSMIVGFSIIAKDISSQTLAQQKSQQLFAQLDSLVKNAPIGIAFLDLKLHFVTVNEYMAKIDGFEVASHIGKTPKDIFPPQMSTKVTENLKKVLQKQKPITFEIDVNTYRSPHLNHWWTVTFYPILIEDEQKGVGVIMQDITEQKTLEKRKDDFISMASHELKTPITSIKAFTQLLNKSITDAKPKQYLDKIENQINRLILIINEMLDVSRIRTGRFTITKEPFDFDELVNDTIQSFSPTHPSHKIVVHGKTNVILKGDKFRLEQVIINLLSNAVKYSPDHNLVDIAMDSDSNKLTFAITDYGIGISKINQDKIFQTFYRVVDTPDGEFPGLGIGLTIASQIVNLHGGNLQVKSSEARGSTFWFTLPLNET